MMYRKIFLKSVFFLLAFMHSPVWANQYNECVYQHSGIDLQQLENSRHVQAFQQLDSSSNYIGTLKGIGGFHLQQFSCMHFGATLTVLLGPRPDSKVLQKVIAILPELLFASVDNPKVQNELKKIPQNTLGTPQHLSQLAVEMGLTDIQLQVLEFQESRILLFTFYGG